EPLEARFAALASHSPSLFSRPFLPGARRAPFVWNRALGVGGSTLHYQGEAHRFPAHAFRMKSERGVAADWPLTHDDPAPWYAKVARLIGVAGEPRNPFKPPRAPYLYGAPPLSRASRRLAQAAARLGWQALPNPVAILPRPEAGRAACLYCNGCVRGCPVGAKGSVDVTVLPAAEQSGRLRIETGFHASRLEHAAAAPLTGGPGFRAEGPDRR